MGKRKHRGSDNDADFKPKSKAQRHDDEGDDSSDNDIAGKPPRKPYSRRGRAGRSSASDVSIGRRARPQQHPGNVVTAHSKRHCTIHAIEKRNALVAAEVYASEDTRELERLEKHINRITLTNVPKPTPRGPLSQRPDLKFQEVTDLLEAEIKAGRTFQAKVDKAKIDKAKVDKAKVDKAPLYWHFGATDGHEYRYFGRTPASKCTKAVADAVGQDLANIINRWPGPLDTISYPAMRAHMRLSPAQVVNAVLHKHGIAGTFHRPIWARLRFEVKLLLIDPVSYEPYSYSTTVSASTTTENNTPDDHHYAHFTVSGKGLTASAEPTSPPQNADGSYSHKTLIPNDLGKNETLRPQCEMAQEIARALTVKMQGMIIDKPNASAMISTLVDLWGTATGRTDGNGVLDGAKTFGNKNLFIVGRNIANRSIQIAPTTVVNERCQTRLPSFTIKSLDRARAIPALEAATNTWLQTGDLKKAWLELARQVDRTACDIANGIPSSNKCSCGPSKSGVHHCGTCGQATLCKKLSTSVYGFNVCPSCISTEQDMKSGLAEKIAVGSLRSSHAKECQRLQEKTTDEQNINIENAALAQIKKRLTGTGVKWTDGYRQMEVTLDYEGPSFGLVYDPFTLTIDAAMPYHPANGGNTMRKHCADNLELTAHAINLAKQMHLPAFLHWLQWYDEHAKRWGNEEISDDEFHEVQEQMVKACSTLRQIRIKANFQRALRDKQKFNQQRFDLDKEEWNSGKIRDEPGLWQDKRYTNRPNARGSWPESTMTRVRHLVRQLQDEFDVELPVGVKDDCPWFGIESSMPEHWGWELCIRMMADRYRRLKDDCNGLDVTVDGPDDIFVEIIFIACVVKGGKFYDKIWTAEEKQGFLLRYSEFLDLPLTADLYDPLCFSIGHRLHGLPMRTGWKKNAQNLADRDDSQNNMLLETRTSNRLKHNYEGTKYTRLRQMVHELNIAQKWYDPDIKLSAVPENLKDDFDQVGDEEGFDFESDMTSAAMDGDFIGEDIMAAADSEEEMSQDADNDGEEGSDEGGERATQIAQEIGTPEQLSGQETMRRELDDVLDLLVANFSWFKEVREVQHLLCGMKEAADMDDRTTFDGVRARLEKYF